MKTELKNIIKKYNALRDAPEAAPVAMVAISDEAHELIKQSVKPDVEPRSLVPLFTTTAHIDFDIADFYYNCRDFVRAAEYFQSVTRISCDAKLIEDACINASDSLRELSRFEEAYELCQFSVDRINKREDDCSEHIQIIHENMSEILSDHTQVVINLVRELNEKGQGEESVLIYCNHLNYLHRNNCKEYDYELYKDLANICGNLGKIHAAASYCDMARNTKIFKNEGGTEDDMRRFSSIYDRFDGQINALKTASKKLPDLLKDTPKSTPIRRENFSGHLKIAVRRIAEAKRRLADANTTGSPLVDANTTGKRGEPEVQSPPPPHSPRKSHHKAHKRTCRGF